MLWLGDWTCQHHLRALGDSVTSLVSLAFGPAVPFLSAWPGRRAADTQSGTWHVPAWAQPWLTGFPARPRAEGQRCRPARPHSEDEDGVAPRGRALGAAGLQHGEGPKPRSRPQSWQLGPLLCTPAPQSQPLGANSEMEKERSLWPLAGSSWRALPPPGDVQAKRFSLPKGLLSSAVVHAGFNSVSQSGCQPQVLFYTLSAPPNCGVPPQSLFSPTALVVSPTALVVSPQSPSLSVPPSPSGQAGQLCTPSSHPVTPQGRLLPGPGSESLPALGVSMEAEAAPQPGRAQQHSRKRSSTLALVLGSP